MQVNVHATQPLTVEAPPAAVTTEVPTLRSQSHRQTVLIALAILALGLFLNTFRSAQAIDMNSDEATYAIESPAFQRTGMTRWNGAPFLVHPPIFFMLEGAYLGLRGVGQSPLMQRLVDSPYHYGEALVSGDVPASADDVAHAIFEGRALPAFYGAAIAALIFVLGSLFRNRWTGLIGAGLFLVDPYVLRRNHYNMLEPLATLFGVLMILVYYRALEREPGRARRWGLLGAGALLGLALLSKELAVLYVPAFLVHAVLFRRIKLRELVAPFGVALGLYALFPLSSAANGTFDIWWSTKTWLFRRLTGQIQDTGLTRPGAPIERGFNVNFFSYFQSLPAKRFILSLLDYAPSFLLLGVAGVLAAFFLYLYWRRGLRDRPAEYLTALVFGCYGFFVIVWRVGGVINEQFFYLVMPVTMLAIAYAVTSWARLRARARGAVTAGRIVRIEYRLARLLALALVVLGVYNAVAWGARYILSRDDSYAQIDGSLANKLAAGTSIVGRDALDIYLLPKQDVYTFSVFPEVPNTIVPYNIVEKKIPYAILNDQALLEGYAGANPGYYRWVGANGDLAYHFEGRIWNTQVYFLDYNRINASATYAADSLAAFQPAVASSTEDPDKLGPALAFDARATTRWSSLESDNQWIYVDLGATKHVGHVELTWEDAYAKSYEIQSSADGEHWVTFFTNTHGKGGFEQLQTNGTGRYIRLLFTKRGTPYGYSLWEIALYP
jgi:4-amino-4-deoxy-L-arabinose transferase-like glycosyltransferase